ncbi:MAG: hypothetical protein OMM_06933 [Candidatus Magnetoglobus multicellularis str. Araruama]|uniref:Uncharacterized protein n=1 Tax=Candidatus Magnetoglobus multicellularis str. Araruama TaxID=890399 RepID=A0A1V1PF65_9BACT|nr:MAG: hypothetical protein OMM_06933 [Candidatus Magnetoglobus multicellularis str. Araruama]
MREEILNASENLYISEFLENYDDVDLRLKNALLLYNSSELYANSILDDTDFMLIDENKNTLICDLDDAFENFE